MRDAYNNYVKANIGDNNTNTFNDNSKNTIIIKNYIERID